VIDYVNIENVDVSSKVWGLVRRGMDGLKLTRDVDAIRGWVQEVVDHQHATLNTFASFEVGDCNHTTLKTDKSQMFMGFIAVDVHHADLIVKELKAPSLGPVHSCTVLINDTRVVSSQHADMDAGLTFVVRGRKTFRVLSSTQSRTTFTSKDIWPSSESDPPQNWHDIVVETGDAIAVPPNRPHCVMSAADTIAVSLTFKQAGVKPITATIPAFPVTASRTEALIPENHGTVSSAESTIQMSNPMPSDISLATPQRDDCNPGVIQELRNEDKKVEEKRLAIPREGKEDMNTFEGVDAGKTFEGVDAGKGDLGLPREKLVGGQGKGVGEIGGKGDSAAFPSTGMGVGEGEGGGEVKGVGECEGGSGYKRETPQVFFSESRFLIF
jgi:hypothetical protein